MGAGIALSTAGVKIYYAVESTAGTKPTTMSSYTEIPGVKGISDLNPEPSQLDCTPLSETGWKQYIPGLKDVGGTVSLTVNNTNAFQTAWASLVTASETGAGTDKATWFVIIIPGLTNAFYFTGTPNALGISAVEVDSVLELDAYIVPNTIEGYATKPTA